MCQSVLVPMVTMDQSPKYLQRQDGVSVAICRCPKCTIDMHIPFDQFPEPEETEDGVFPTTPKDVLWDPDKT